MQLFFYFGIAVSTTGTILWLSNGLANAQLSQLPRVPSSSISAPSIINSVGQVSPAAPIEIVVMNSHDSPIGIGFSGGANVTLDPGEEVSLSFPIAPVNLFLYPFDPGISIQGLTAIDGNTISVEVIAVDEIAPGDISVNVDLAGNVYFF